MTVSQSEENNVFIANARAVESESEPRSREVFAGVGVGWVLGVGVGVGKKYFLESESEKKYGPTFKGSYLCQHFIPRL